jgi:prevent-host-death family protein
MKETALQDFRDNLGRYLGKVRRGEEILISERGKIFARISPCEMNNDKNTRSLLLRLAKTGQILLPAAGRGKPQGRPRKVRAKGIPLSRTIIENRR